MSGDALALPDEYPLWDAHDHPDRPLDHGAVLCSCVTCEAMILAQAERTPGIGIALATRCDRIVVAAEYLAEVMSVDRTLAPLLYVRDDYVRRLYLPVDGWWFVPPRRWWSEACHEDEAAAGRRHPRHRVAKRQSDANRRPWHVTAAEASACGAPALRDAGAPPLHCECYGAYRGPARGELADLAAAGARLLRHARPLAE
jgi:hypothetical protein